MSGFEVAGLVLGAIPLVVSVLEYYMRGADMFENFRSYKRILKRLIHCLKTEHVNLKNACENLLIGIAPPILIEAMIEDTFGDLWKETDIVEKLRLRLWTSLDIFEKNLHDVWQAIEEMKERLNIGPDGKVEWAESKSFKNQFKRVLFILQQSNHERILTRIRDGVFSLERLVAANAGLEPARKARSQGRLNKLVNEVSNSIYQALRSTMRCQCPSLHDVGLKLAPPSKTLTPEDEDDDFIQALKFRVAISNMAQSLEPHLKEWNEIVLQMSDRPKRLMMPAAAQTTVSSRKRTRFHVASLATKPMSGNHSTQTSIMMQSTVANLAGSALNTATDLGQAQHIDNLCETMRRMGKKRSGSQCGHIKDCSTQKKLNFEVRMLDCLGSADEWALVPLSQALQHPSLLYKGKLRLAWVIACSALQIYGTPWIYGGPRNKLDNDIYVLQTQGVPQYQSVFVLKPLPEPAQPSHLRAPEPCSSGSFLLSLGILLIELILGQPMEDLRTAQKQRLDIQDGVTENLMDYDAAIELLGRVAMFGGSGYRDTVERCLECGIHQTRSGAGQSSLYSNVFAEIIMPLEEDLRTLLSQDRFTDQGKETDNLMRKRV